MARLPKRPPSSFCEDRDLQRVPRVTIRFSASVRATSMAPSEPTGAVVVAALGHRVDVRAEEQRFREGSRPARRPMRLPAASTLARAALAHQPVTVARLPVSVAVGDSAHAALGILAEFRQRSEVGLEAAPVHAQGRLQPVGPGQCDAGEAREQPSASIPVNHWSPPWLGIGSNMQPESPGG